mmetsp:Transcript_39014/g.107441  ORF Transcript_39014/g.107441 Transcript_39014/m.107441 type:complete len:291 (-) Transcript_39014:1536-2408(-)
MCSRPETSLPRLPPGPMFRWAVEFPCNADRISEPAAGPHCTAASVAFRRSTWLRASRIQARKNSSYFPLSTIALLLSEAHLARSWRFSLCMALSSSCNDEISSLKRHSVSDMMLEAFEAHTASPMRQQRKNSVLEISPSPLSSSANVRAACPRNLLVLAADMNSPLLKLPLRLLSKAANAWSTFGYLCRKNFAKLHNCFFDEARPVSAELGLSHKRLNSNFVTMPSMQSKCLKTRKAFASYPRFLAAFTKSVLFSEPLLPTSNALNAEAKSANLPLSQFWNRSRGSFSGL